MSFNAPENCREIIRQVIKCMSQGKSTKHLIDQMEELKKNYPNVNPKRAFKEVLDEQKEEGA